MIELTDMKKISRKISEKSISEEFNILNLTHSFLTSLQRKTHSELEYLLKKLETEYSDELAERCNFTYRALQNIEKKINWEMKRCTEFDLKVDNFNKQQQLKFVSDLSKKILNKEK